MKSENPIVCNALAVCAVAASRNSVVANALAASLVQNGRIEHIVDYIKRTPYVQSVGKSGNTIHYDSTDFRREDKERIRRKIEAHLAKRVNLAACHIFFGPDANHDDIHDSETFLRVDIPMSAVRNSSVAKNAAYWEKFKVGQEIYYKNGPFQELGTIEAIDGRDWKYKIKDRKSGRIIEITHADIAYAINSTVVAKNGRIEDKVRVTMDCFDFNGRRKVTKVMTLAALKQLIAQIESTASFDVMASRLERDGYVDDAIDPTVTLKVSWASRA